MRPATTYESERWTQWQELWALHFFSFTTEEARAWENALRYGARSFPGLTESEVLEAIHDMAELFRSDRNPKLRHLQGRIRQRRESRKHNKVENQQTLESLKLAIRDETDPARIWDLVCQPSAYLDCSILEDYAMNVHPGWRRPRMKMTLPEVTHAPAPD